MVARGLRTLAVLAGCGGHVDPATAPSGSAASSCVLAGSYRVRVGNPSYGMWWHFEVRRDAGAEPTIHVSWPEQVTAKVKLDEPACKLAIDGTIRDDPFALTATVDRTSHAVHGTSEYRGAGAPRPPADVMGVIDRVPATMPASCFTAGVFALTSSASWTCEPVGRSVGMYAPFAVFAVRVEPMFDSVIVYRVKPEPPYEPLGGDEVVTRDGCSVTLKTTYGRRMDATLVFHGDGFDGRVHHMEYGGADSGGSWQCTVTEAPFEGSRIR
jgi:hypothetical protein